MESHKCIRMLIVKFALNGLLVHILRYRVVDIQKCYGILANAGSDKLAEYTVDIHLTGYRNSSSGETAVDITWYKTELCLECRPALSCNCNILAIALVCINPIKKSQLILCQLLKDLRLFVACAKFLLHICHNLRDSCIPCMLVKCLKQIQLRILFDFNAQIVQLLNWCVAGKEIKRSRSERNNLQIL